LLGPEIQLFPQFQIEKKKRKNNFKKKKGKEKILVGLFASLLVCLFVCLFVCCVCLVRKLEIIHSDGKKQKMKDNKGKFQE